MTIHYSCDRCKRIINPEEDLRYVVKLEVEAAMEPLEVDEFDDDRDHLMEVQEILERLEDSDSELVSDDLYQRRRFDLCAGMLSPLHQRSHRARRSCSVRIQPELITHANAVSPPLEIPCNEQAQNCRYSR